MDHKMDVACAAVAVMYIDIRGVNCSAVVQDISGLSWKEEGDIRRALNASMRCSYSRHESNSSIVNVENDSASGQQSLDG